MKALLLRETMRAVASLGQALRDDGGQKKTTEKIRD